MREWIIKKVAKLLRVKIESITYVAGEGTRITLRIPERGGK